MVILTVSKIWKIYLDSHCQNSDKLDLGFFIKLPEYVIVSGTDLIQEVLFVYLEEILLKIHLSGT